MRPSISVPMLVIMYSVIAAPLEDQDRDTSRLTRKRDTEAYPIPTLLPRSHLQTREDDGIVEYALTKQDKDGKITTNHLKEPTKDFLWCQDLNIKDWGNATDYYVTFDALCYFYEKNCNPDNGQSGAIFRWEGKGEDKDVMKVEHDWKINSWACHWQKQTLGKDIKIGMRDD